MNILIVTGIFPPDIGGPATYVPRVASGFLELGHTVKVVTLAEQVDEQAPEYAYQVIRVNRKSSRLVRSIRTFVTILREASGSEVIFVNGLALESTLASLITRTSMVHKIVGDFAWERATLRAWTTDDFETFQLRRQGLGSDVLKRLRSWWTGRADLVIVPSQYLKRCVRGWGIDNRRIRIIPNIVDRSESIVEKDVPLQTKHRIATAVRLVPWKCVDGIIDALGRLSGVGLIVIGDGPERTRLTELVTESGLLDQVYFAGALPHAETLSLITSCDAFILNSTYEGLPHILIEVMWLGIPVIATSAGGTPELISDGENGLLVPSGDSQALAKSIERLLADGDLQKKITNEGRRTVRTQPKLSAMIESTESALKEAVQIHLMNSARGRH